MQQETPPHTLKCDVAPGFCATNVLQDTGVLMVPAVHAHMPGVFCISCLACGSCYTLKHARCLFAYASQHVIPAIHIHMPGVFVAYLA